MKASELYGPELSQSTTLTIARSLSQSAKGEALAAEFIRKVDAKEDTNLAFQLLDLKGSLKAFDSKQLKEAADLYVKLASASNAAMESGANLAAARTLLRSKNGTDLAIDYIRKVEEQLKGETANAGTAFQVLDLKTGIKSIEEKDLKAAAELYLKFSKATTPAMELNVNLTLARTLLKAKTGATLAVEYAKKAESLLGKDDPIVRSASVLKVLASALRA